MGRLFEGITFDYQAEMRKMREATEAAQKQAEASKREYEAAKQEHEAAKQEREAAKRDIEAAKQELKISRYIAKMLSGNYSVSEIKTSLKQEFGLSEEQADEEYRRAME